MYARHIQMKVPVFESSYLKGLHVEDLLYVSISEDSVTRV